MSVKKTRCTDQYLHVFHGDAVALTKSGAMSREVSRKKDADQNKADRDMDNGGSIVSSKRGLGFDQRHAVVQTSLRRSTDKAMHLATLTATVSKSLEELNEQSRDCMELLKVYNSMDDFPSINEQKVAVIKELGEYAKLIALRTAKTLCFSSSLRNSL